MGEILEKLNFSIDRSVGIMSKNPVIALKLTRGFDKKDVKKAYRTLALKYHPGRHYLILRHCKAKYVMQCLVMK